MRYYLAVDIGASAGRHILAHIEGGKIIAEEIYRFSNTPEALPGTPGALGCQGGKRLMWNAKRLFREILNGLKKAGELGKAPYSVGVDTWGVDYVLLDEKDEPIGGVYCYRDGRTKSAVASVHRRVPFAELYAKTGIQFQAFNTVYQLYDDKRTGRSAKARSFLMLPDYFHFLLTGVKKQEYTNATTTGMVNTLTHTWDEEIIEKLDYKKEWFGELAQPGTEAGEFTEEVASIVGYRAKVILPATHDTAGAVLSAPLEGQTPYISSGAWSLLGIERNRAYTTDKARELNYSNEGSVGGRFRLQKNIMGLWMIRQVRRELGDKYDFATLTSLAKISRVGETVDVNDARFLSPVSMIDAINASVGKQLSAGGMAYCIFNSLAKSYAESLEGLEKLTGESYSTLNIIGTGSKNELLNELTAKYTGKKIVTGPTEGTAIGNFLMQMVGAGELPSVGEGRKMIEKSFDIVEL